MKKHLKKLIVVLVLGFIVSIISYSYAIFKSNTNPSGSVKLAKWSVDLVQTGANNHISVIPGDATSTADYSVSVTSLSEVNIVYSIVIENVPAGVSIDLDNSGTFISPTSANKVIFNEIGTINYSDASHTKTHILTFKAESNTQYTVDEEINVNVVARQVLPN